MHLMINLVFLTSFQLINWFNLALWVNNRCKWITVIFLNLWCVIIFYIIWFVFFFCLWSLPLFIFVLYSPYFRHWPNPTVDAINLLCTTFLNFTFFCFFFLSLVFIFAQLPVNKEQTDKNYTNIFSNLYKLYSLSLSISLFYII